MNISLISVLAIVAQISAAFFSLKLIKLTGIRTAWVFIALGFCIMAVRRAFLIEGFHSIFGQLENYKIIDNVLVLVISILMLIGVVFIAPLFHSIKQSKEVLQQSKKDLERKVAEQTAELREANARLSVELDERRRAEYRLAKYAEELKLSNADLEQFAYVASHDLQEPLRMVSSFSQLLAKRYRGKLDQDADEFIDFAVDGARRMQALINDLLAYSRVGTRKGVIEPTESSEILQKSLNNLKPLIEETHTVLTHDRLPTIAADGNQLVQVFQNLIANAIKFRGPELPRIHISVEHQNNGWKFAVRDNGIGIAPEYQERIFTIFQRLHPRSEYSGTGIGLAICKKIIERHGGRIWVDSALGQGSTFYFTITGNIGAKEYAETSLSTD